PAAESDVGGHAAEERKADALVLDAAIGIDEPGAHGTDLGAHGVLDESLQPVLGQHLGVVVEEQQKVAVDVRRAVVLNAGVVVIVAVVENAAREVGEVGVGLGLLALIVDDEEFVIIVRRLLDDAGDARLEQVEPVARGDDDRDQWLAGNVVL